MKELGLEDLNKRTIYLGADSDVFYISYPLLESVAKKDDFPFNLATTKRKKARYTIHKYYWTMNISYDSNASLDESVRAIKIAIKKFSKLPFLENCFLGLDFSSRQLLTVSRIETLRFMPKRKP